jgi:hypothetical protein
MHTDGGQSVHGCAASRRIAVCPDFVVDPETMNVAGQVYLGSLSTRPIMMATDGGSRITRAHERKAPLHVPEVSPNLWSASGKHLGVARVEAEV